MRTIAKFALVVLLSMQLSACGLGILAAGIGAAKMGNAKKSEAHAKKMDSYNNYVKMMRDMNMQSQKLGIAPEHIMTPAEYNKEA
jgi:bifunctional ADP-heptose synthase (sugar kinase/adenylyltransferase)